MLRCSVVLFHAAERVWESIMKCIERKAHVTGEQFLGFCPTCGTLIDGGSDDTPNECENEIIIRWEEVKPAKISDPSPPRKPIRRASRRVKLLDAFWCVALARSKNEAKKMLPRLEYVVTAKRTYVMTNVDEAAHSKEVLEFLEEISSKQVPPIKLDPSPPDLINHMMNKLSERPIEGECFIIVRPIYTLIWSMYNERIIPLKQLHLAVGFHLSYSRFLAKREQGPTGTELKDFLSSDGRDFSRARRLPARAVWQGTISSLMTSRAGFTSLKERLYELRLLLGTLQLGQEVLTVPALHGARLTCMVIRHPTGTAQNTSVAIYLEIPPVAKTGDVHHGFQLDPKSKNQVPTIPYEAQKDCLLSELKELWSWCDEKSKQAPSEDATLKFKPPAPPPGGEETTWVDEILKFFRKSEADIINLHEKIAQAVIEVGRLPPLPKGADVRARVERLWDRRKGLLMLLGLCDEAISIADKKLVSSVVIDLAERAQHDLTSTVDALCAAARAVAWSEHMKNRRQSSWATWRGDEEEEFFVLLRLWFLGSA